MNDMSLTAKPVSSGCFTFLVGVLARVYLVYSIYYQWKRRVSIPTFPPNTVVSFLLCSTPLSGMEPYLRPRFRSPKGCAWFGALCLLGGITTPCCLVSILLGGLADLSFYLSRILFLL